MDAKQMATENKKYKQPIISKAIIAMSKTGKSLNANEKFCAEFYKGLTLAMHFQMNGEEEP